MSNGTSYACCPGKGCVKINNSSGMTQDQCKAGCTSSSKFKCDATSKNCVMDNTNGTTTDPTCGGSCTSLTDCTKAGSSKKWIWIILIVIIILAIAGGAFYFYKRRRR